MVARVRLGHRGLQVEEEADPGALPEGSQADVRGEVCLVRGDWHSYADTGTDMWLFS